MSEAIEREALETYKRFVATRDEIDTGAKPWSALADYFTEDAVYEGDPEDARGRDAVLAKLKAGVDAFDRNMDSRTPDFQPPTVDGDTLRMTWSVTYTKAGAPDLVISGVELATFEGDRIARLRDDFDPEAQKRMGEWMAAHGALLQSG